MEQRYITRGIAAEIPIWLQNMLWFLRDSMEVTEKDYLQVFRLTAKDNKQEIVHEQEQPPYKAEYLIEAPDAVTKKVYIIDNTEYVTMLLAEEY